MSQSNHNTQESNPNHHQPNILPSRAPSLGPVQPQYQYNYSLSPVDGNHSPRQLQSANSIMRHENRSVPSVSSQHTDSANGPVPPLPPYDPSPAIDGFANMRISDPIPRGTSAMSYASDPIPRAGTSMSIQSYQNSRGLPPNPRHAHTLPPPTTYSAPPRPPPDYTPDLSQHEDILSLYATDDGESLAYDGSADTDQRSTYSQEDPSLRHARAPQDHHPSYSQYPVQPQYQQGWYGQQVSPPPSQTGPRPGEYSTLYAAASDVLGMGPPPGQPPPQAYPQQSQSAYSSNPSFMSSQTSMVSVNQSAPYFGPGGLNTYNQGGGPGPSSYSTDTLPTQLIRPAIDGDDDGDPGSRPLAQRSETGASIALRTQKTKAVDLSAPPYTKEYIDEYRHRIKADPDPEAHFLYAKYLIDAAKKVGADAKDQRSVRKYRDALVTEALKVIRRLATQGQPFDDAQFFLANCYGTGALGLQVDHERAYHLYLQAAKQNHAAAAYRVGVCNEIAVGTRKEPSRAIAFYRKSASLGDTAAMYKVGMILLQGTLGEQRNPREAISWLRRAAEQADEENPHALYELGQLHEAPNSGLVPYDPVYAKRLYTQAGQLGYTQAQCKLGHCYETGSLTCPVDPKRSIAWYTKAAEKGNADAELALSGWYLTGCEGVLKQSDSEAYLWARRAANQGLSKAEYAVGYYAEVGIGIKQDIEFAKRWYMRAAAQGNRRAMNRLTEMKRTGGKRVNTARPTRQDAKDECVIG